MLNGNILVTGATGFLGSHFVREWLRTETGHIFALVRGKQAQTGTDRLAAALETARQASGAAALHIPTASLTPIEGDVTQPLAGISSGTVDRLRETGIEVFWHLASDLRFEDRNRDVSRRTNVDGTSHALSLAVALGVRRFVYVSTAFVCGRHGGLIEETLVSPNDEFSNGYEASKAEAERLLATECERLGLPLTILRPSIIVGPRATKSAYGSDSGLYSLIHAAMAIRSSQSAQSAHLRVPAIADAEINFVPVDCVVADMFALAKSDFGDKPIYHLTSASCVSVAQCWQVMSEATGMQNVALLTPNSFEPPPAERLIARRIGFFLSYIGVDRRFTRSLVPAWTLDAADFAGYVRKCVERIEANARESHAG